MTALKAYIVNNGDPNESAIEFAETPGKARAQASREWGCEFTEVMAERAPEFDEYAEAGCVPIQAMLDSDWWFECDTCGRRVYKDDEDDLELAPVVIGSFVYHKGCVPKERIAR